MSGVDEDEDIEAFWNTSEITSFSPLAPPPPPKRTRTVRVLPQPSALWGEAPEVPGDLDTPDNPYLQEEVNPNPDPTGKVSFYEPTHSYALCDARGTYPNLILSGSKVVTYMTHFWQEGLGEPTRLAPVTEACRHHGDSRVSGDGLLGNVQLFQRALAAYLCKFCEDTERKAPYSYHERANFFYAFCGGRDMAYFLPSPILTRLESWLLSSSRELSSSFFDTLDLDADEDLLYQELYSHVMACWGEQHPRIRQACSTRITLLVFDSLYAEERYSIPSKYGTALHAYLEHRVLGETREACRLKHPVAEQEDEEYVEAFLADYTPTIFAHSEYRVASFRHKICGSIDGVEVLADGTWVLWDLKRTPHLFGDVRKRILLDIYNPGQSKDKNVSRKFCVDSDGIYHVLSANISKSDQIYEYMVQLAVYRQLCRLNGKPMADYAMILNAHPLFKSYRVIRLPLSRPCNGVPSPIRLVQWIFNQREKHLCAYFGLTKSS